MKSLGLAFVVLILAAGCRSVDSRSSLVVGEYVYSVTGSTYYLTLKQDSAYGLRDAGSFQKRPSSEQPYHEDGLWRWEGTSIVLLPQRPFSDSPFFASVRKLYPLETSKKRKVLVPVLNRGNRPAFDFIFIKFDEPAKAPDDFDIWPPVPPEQSSDHENKPNQSLLPTPTAVTPPAAQVSRQP